MKKRIAALFFALVLLLSAGCGAAKPSRSAQTASSGTPALASLVSVDPDALPAYSGTPYTVLGDNVPTFADNEKTTGCYAFYSELDTLGRCGPAVACIGQSLMPTGTRGSIGQVKPTGWHTVKYDSVDGKYLYNRSHIIGWQLAGENANEKNLITGTRYFNVEGMLPFENMVADYVKETGNHVLYRVAPVFSGDELVARGVSMEAWSVEDSGDGVCFYVFCYNVQPGICIDYATGTSSLSDSSAPTAAAQSGGVTYVLNTNTHKFHKPSCASVSDISEENRVYYTGTRESLLEDGYTPCGRCNP